MKQKFSLFVFFGLLVVILSSYKSGAANNNGTDGTGAEGTSVGNGCSGGNCHGSTSSIAPIVELDSAGISVPSYHPGAAYTIKISATNSTGSTLPKFGFQLACVTAASGGTTSATDAGTWGAVPTNVRNTSAAASGLNCTIIEQSRAITATTGTGANGTTYVESIPWTAPAAGTGSVNIYGVMNAVNGNGNADQGDQWQQASPVTITEAVNCPSVSISATTTTLTASPSGATGYVWYLNGSPVSGATSSTYTPTHSGSYTVKVTSTGGCVGTSAATQFIVLGINETSLAADLQVYPTVTSGTVNVDINGAINSALSYNVYGLDGRIAAHGTIAAASTNAKIDMSTLGNGLYIMNIADQNRTATFKLIKQ